MTDKASGKGGHKVPPEPVLDDMQTAYQVHTLSQMVYGHLATTHPWLQTGHGTPPLAVAPPAAWPAAWGQATNPESLTWPPMISYGWQTWPC